MDLLRALPFARRRCLWRWLALAALALVAAGEGPQRLERAMIARPLELTLDRAVEIALWQNPQIRVALQEVERRRGAVIEVRAQALPQIALSASYEQRDRRLLEGGGGAPSVAMPPPQLPDGGSSPTPSPSPSPAPTPSPSPTPPAPRPEGEEAPPSFSAGKPQTKAWQVTLTARQVLYAGGRIRAGVAMARLAEDEAVFRVRDTIEQVIAQVRRQFALALLNRELIAVQEESVTLLESQAADQRERYAAGTVPRFNVLQAEVALANARPALTQARNQAHLAQLELAKTLGYDTRGLAGVAEPFRLRGEMVVAPITVTLVEALWQARERRASLKAQRMQILIEIEDVALQRAGYKPTLEAHAGYTVQNSALSSSLGDVVHGWFFGVQGNWTIFDGMETAGKVHQARARLAQARLFYEEALLQVDFEVQQAWARLQEARETIRGQEQTVVQAREAVRLARERLAAGVGTQLDVLNAAVSLTQARSTELQARYDDQVAKAELDRVTATATRYHETFSDPLANRRFQKRFRKRVPIGR